jgi:hypothetical protein
MNSPPTTLRRRLRLKISLERFRPTIWRRVEVDDGLSFEEFHRVILLRPALYETHRPELFRGETGAKSHAVVGRIFSGISVGQGAYRARGSMGGKRQGSSGS